jgi:multicomponent Na+:H+ antiporter subunit C
MSLYLQQFPLASIVLVTGLLMILIGLWGMLTNKNLIRMIIGISIMETGVNVILVSLGYIQGKTAPILDTSELQSSALSQVVDPIPSALVLTSIVIGLGTTALMLSYVIKMYKEKQTLNIEEYGVLKW